MSEQTLRDELVSYGRSLFDRGYSCGTAGNLSVRLADGFLVTPTNTSLGSLHSNRLSKVSSEGAPLSGDKPSKEATLHIAWYRSHPEDNAVVHLHSTYSVAVSCLADANPGDVLPPLTPYFVMRIGRLPLVPYHPPGDPALAEEIERLGFDCRAVLLANHGPVVGGRSLAEAIAAAEELEEASRVFLLLRGEATRCLTADQCQELARRFRP